MGPVLDDIDQINAQVDLYRQAAIKAAIDSAARTDPHRQTLLHPEQCERQSLKKEKTRVKSFAKPAVILHPKRVKNFPAKGRRQCFT